MINRRRDKAVGHHTNLPGLHPVSTTPYPEKSLPNTTSFTVNWPFIKGLVVTWLVLVHYFERSHVKHTIKACRWNKWEQWDHDNPPHRVVLIADPQIVDEYSYPDKPWAVQWLMRTFADNYLHRNYMFASHLLDPDTTFFLGDLFDGGREWDDRRWFKEYKRYKRLFPSKVGRRTYDSIPGNHDIGFHTVHRNVSERFSQYFGNLNDYVEIGNHSIVMLDTISMSNSDPDIAAESVEFLEQINSKLNPQFPRVLLVHVPFYRFPDTQVCGPLREKKDKPFPLQRGNQYQTVIEYEISQRVLSVVHPDLIFAGDDHDYCDIQQPYTYDNENKIAREIAVKSAAMSSGIKYPAIQLLSLNNPTDSPSLVQQETFQTHMCYMPTPMLSIGVYFVVVLALLAFVVLRYLYPRKLYIYMKRVTQVISNPTNGWARNKFQHHLDFDTERNVASFTLHLLIVFIIPIFILYLYITNV